MITLIIPIQNEMLIFFYFIFIMFEILTVHRQQHSFLHTDGCTCESVKVFETENVST